jgi:hypothetical protein
MSRKPSMNALAATRRQRKALRTEMARVSKIADEAMRRAIAEGFLKLDRLPASLQQRIAALDGKGLEARVEGGEIKIIPSGGQDG